jgi:hypothetical protein
MITLLIAVTVLALGIYLISSGQALWGAAGAFLGVFLLAPGLINIVMHGIEHFLITSAPLLAALATVLVAAWGLKIVISGR